MLDIKFIRENREKVIENIKNKFQDKKIPLVDEAIELDKKIRELKLEGDELRKERNTTSDSIGSLYREKRGEEAEEKKKRVIEINEKLVNIEREEEELLVPAQEEFIVGIDQKQKLITVELPEGLLNLEELEDDR